MKYRLRKNYSKEPMFALRDILLDRGVTDLDNFLHPTKKCELNPYDLENIKLAATVLLNHLRMNSKILMVIDADCDGFTSSSILWLYIKHIYPQADLSFTVHEHKQHGLGDKIDWIENQDFRLVIVPDAGSFDVKEHKRLYDRGIGCICLDHHTIPKDDDGNDILPDPKYAIVVNNQLSPNYTNKTLCGAGVVYKFCEVLDNELGIQQAENYLDLTALGEIADVMDRTDAETNYIMIHGLENVNNKGFKTLLNAQSYSLKSHGEPPYTGLNPIDIAWYIAPLINALTRVGSIEEKENMFYCFVEPDRIVQSTKRGAKSGDTETAAEQTARVGKNAKARQDKIKEKAIDLIDFKIQKNELDRNNIILVEIDDGDNIPQEVTGLVAMSVVNKYHKPCMIGRRNDKNEIQGSIRSDANFIGLPSFKKFLEDSGLTTYVAGHDAAAGWGLAVSRIQSLMDYANTHLSAADFENVYLVDYILDARQNNYELLYTLAEHPEYFGNHIDEIRVVVENISLENIQVMGPNKDCLKIIYNGMDYVKFRNTDFIEDIMSNRMKKLTVYGKLNLNEYMGRVNVQMIIEDYELKDDSHKYDF